MNLSYANYIADDLSFGVTLKTCKVIASDSKILDSNTPVLIDLGLLFSTDGFIKDDPYNERLNFGLAIQNFGGKLRQKLNLLSLHEYSYNIPRYLKLGFSYEFDIKKNNSLKLFKMMLTGEYKDQFNYNMSMYENYPVEYWGLGTEFIFYDIFSLRLGGILNSHNSILGSKNKFPIRIGAGLNVPFEFLLNNSPFSLSFDFSNIPVNEEIFGRASQINKNLWAFNLQLTYNKSIF